MNSVYLSWKKNQEPNNLINQKDKYIVPSTDIQKIDEIHSREKFKDFLDYRTLQKLLFPFTFRGNNILNYTSVVVRFFFKFLSVVDKSLKKNLLKW